MYWVIVQICFPFPPAVCEICLRLIGSDGSFVRLMFVFFLEPTCLIATCTEKIKQPGWKIGSNERRSLYQTSKVLVVVLEKERKGK